MKVDLAQLTIAQLFEYIRSLEENNAAMKWSIIHREVPLMSSFKYDPYRGIDGFVYLARADGFSLVKVGWSTNPKKRVQGICASSPVPVRLVYSTPGRIEDEERLHGLLAEWQSKGEWFHITDRLCEVLVEEMPDLDIGCLQKQRPPMRVVADSAKQTGSV